jgi:hypothetical protein
MMDQQQQLFFMGKAIEVLKEIYDTEQQHITK